MGEVGHFESDASDSLVQLRDTLASLVRAAGKVSDRGAIRGGADLQRALGISNTLAWQVFRIAQASDPLAEGCTVPRRRAMERLLQAALQRGVAEELIQKINAATCQFERVVKAHARSRREFDSMLSGITSDGSSSIDLNQRRQAFAGNSHIWGLQTRAKLCCTILHPGSQPSMHDFAQLNGQFELKRLRRDAPIVLARLRCDHEDGVECDPIVRESIDPEGDTEAGVALLSDFSTPPVNEIITTTTESGFTRVEITGNQLGKQSEVSCTLGHVARNIGCIYAQKNDRHFWARSMVRAPTEVLIHDVLVFADMFGPIEPRAMVYSDLRVGDSAIPYEDAELLSIGESVNHLGRGPAFVNSPDIPRYPEMINYVCDRLGWDANRFDVYRCRVEYPVLPSSVVVEFDLPEPPKTGEGSGRAV